MANITPYSQRPTDIFAQMRKEMDDLITSWFGRAALAPVGPSSFASMPAPLDLRETENEFVVRVDLPGMSEKDIKVTFQNDTLTVRGERREEKSETKGETRYSERSYGMFSRTITLPASVKGEEIRARYKDGVMEIHLPKVQKTAAREIKIETAG